MRLNGKKYYFWTLWNILCLMKEKHTLCCGNRSEEAEMGFKKSPLSKEVNSGGARG
jgi:hypothetical protein